MFEKNMRLAYLLDFYGDILDDHSKSIMRAYYEDDLSLAEIAAGENISRQGVRHIIKKSEEQLDFLEEKLGLAEHYLEIESCAKKLKSISSELDAANDAKLKSFAADINSSVEIILSKSI